MPSRALPALACASLCALARAAAAEEPIVPPAKPPPMRAIDPKQVTGMVRPAVEEDDARLEVASALLLVPRWLVKAFWFAGGLTAGLIRDEQVVPRVEEMLSPSPGNISVIPSLFLDTRRRTSAGVQMLAGGNQSATRLSFGFGGIHDLVGEGRLLFGLPRPFPMVFSIEGLADSRSTLDYIGLGQEPDKDPRNHFRADAMTHAAAYYERRVRALASVGMRFGPSFELFLSSSMLRSRVEDTPGGEPSTISKVFVPGTVTGAPGAFSTFAESRIIYTELALRYDTRSTDARPSPGVFAEAYGGIARGTGDDPSRFWRGGGRIAAFFPIVRNTNILSPKVALDGMIIDGNSPVPFTAFTSQPDFRGIDNRLDKVSLVVSFDYRWSVIRYMGLRLFVDMATVGPDLGAMFDAPKRWAGGFGVDVFSSSSELAQFIASFSNEGARAFFTFGLPTLFGDRQHRR